MDGWTGKKFGRENARLLKRTSVRSSEWLFIPLQNPIVAAADDGGEGGRRFRIA
jgi:hypothetical protein